MFTWCVAWEAKKKMGHCAQSQWEEWEKGRKLSLKDSSEEEKEKKEEEEEEEEEEEGFHSCTCTQENAPGENVLQTQFMNRGDSAWRF